MMFICKMKSPTYEIRIGDTEVHKFKNLENNLTEGRKSETEIRMRVEIAE